MFYSLSAYPIGILSDRADRLTILAAGLVLLVLADIVLASTSGIAGVCIGVALWGLHMGFTQGLLTALIAETAPAELRGTAFGMFNLITGIALLAASIIAGALWDQLGPQATFLAGAGLAMASLVGLWCLRGPLRRQSSDLTTRPAARVSQLRR
ncbi:MAG: MFS transporter [Rhodocyclaceae bacterium]